MRYLCGNCFQQYEEKKESICPYCHYDNTYSMTGNTCLPKGYLLNERYMIGRVLGMGGFGITYLGYDTVLSQIVAIKEYLPGEFSTRIQNQEKVTIYTGEKENQFHIVKKIFVEEAKRLAQFQDHDGIVHIYGCFDDNNTSYILMEYLKGKTIQALQWEKRLFTVQEAVNITCKVLTALEDVHNMGMLHCDITPDNIILTDSGQVKLVDFGAARYEATSHLKSLSVIIKQGYAPIEQYQRTGDQGAWTDVYGAAATMYKMITGVTPKDPMERILKDDLVPPSKLGIEIDKSTENALLNALNVLPEGRYQSASDFCNALQSASVRRSSLKIRNTDLGYWTKGIKLGLGILAGALAVVFVLILQGKFELSVGRWKEHPLEQGQSWVPNLVNTDLQKAQSIAEESKLALVIVNKEYSDQIPKGKVLMQAVDAGSIVDAGTVMGVTISGGRKRDQLLDSIAEDETIVPDVQYKSEAEAVSLMAEAGLTVVIEYEESNIVEVGKVIRQETAEFEIVKKGTSIKVVVSKKRIQKSHTEQRILYRHKKMLRSYRYCRQNNQIQCRIKAMIQKKIPLSPMKKASKTMMIRKYRKTVRKI